MVESDLLESWVEMAVIVTGPELLGAVKSPVWEIVPADTFQESDALNVPVPCTLAEHWSV